MSGGASGPALPPGYLRRTIRGAEVVACAWALDALQRAIEGHGTLIAWGAAQPSRDALQGRGIAWGASLSAGADGAASTPVVVRHSRHGGLLAPITGDLFVRPTRAPLELTSALRLTAARVPTPEVIAHAVYPAAAIFARSDVVTRRLPPGGDLPAVWQAASPAARTALVSAVAVLMRQLTAADALHPDLNIKNVYVAGTEAPFTAYVLDVDRVVFSANVDVAARNFARFARSARKWNARHQLGFDDDALVRLASLAWDKP